MHALSRPAVSTSVINDAFVKDAAAYFRKLQDRICASFEGFEDTTRFEQTEWERPAGHRLKGGGRMRVMRGKVFEKVGVNVSHVWGTLSDEGIKQVHGAKESGGAFVATGISLVSHMANPMVPIVHMNLRLMATSRCWFGGGADLTPTFPIDEDTMEFHESLRAACDRYRPDAYAQYKQWCDRYFYLPHRQEPRGVGGIFFDDLNSGDLGQDFSFVRDVGNAFVETYPKIVARRQHMAFTDDDLQKLMIKRGRYVEFNLVYDRGTKFGFATDANPDAYLMSMPPTAKWP
ncbi:MAG: oxygen-dependent coproporphyrinogen oxidase [Rhodospirillaceae bacterium]